MGIISTKLRASAAGQECTFRIPSICNGDTATTVLCHAPNEVRGMGSKGHDYHAAFGCSSCHVALDEHRLPKGEELFYWLRGIMRTQNVWVERGLLVLPVDPVTAKRRPKKRGNWPKREIQSRNTLARGELWPAGKGDTE